MSHAKELLNLLLSSSVAPPIQNQQNPTLTATIVTKPPPIISVQAFNAQLVIAGKDEALRKAASLFKTAADNMERGRVKADRYWIDALKIRRKNYGLVPAPLPYGSAMGKGADRTSKDFVVSFGLEQCQWLLQLLHVADVQHFPQPLQFSDGGPLPTCLPLK